MKKQRTQAQNRARQLNYPAFWQNKRQRDKSNTQISKSWVNEIPNQTIRITKPDILSQSGVANTGISNCSTRKHDLNDLGYMMRDAKR